MEQLFTFIAENSSEMLRQTGEHIALTFIALAIAILAGLPLGILATRFKKLETSVLGSVGVIQTIPSIALLGILLPVFGIGVVPAVVALFLYALLPIVRNVHSGINGVDHSVTEAARGMGMSDNQILAKIELPLAVPVIFAGIRTATVINVGVATLCALIGAGGLGEFIFRGIALNNVQMILAGAVPAAFLALGFDVLLGFIQKHIKILIKPFFYSSAVLLIVIVPWLFISMFDSDTRSFRAGMPTEFMERSDGYKALKQHYGFDLPTMEMNQALMYQAIKNGRVDVIGGYSTDGRIDAFDLKVLRDNENFFPPYSAAPLIHQETLRQFPELENALGKLSGLISNEDMIEMNFRVDEKGESPKTVAINFLKEKGLRTDKEREGTDEVIVGGKNFTEQFILAEMFKNVIENYTDLTVGTRLGLAGTQIVFGALTNREIDLYPEYTGTGLYVLLKRDSKTAAELGNSQQQVFEYVKEEIKKEFNLVWLDPLGFENTYAMMMRSEQANRLGIETISDLVEYLDNRQVPLR
jgi:osmoprotectant transport system permease protein